MVPVYYMSTSLKVHFGQFDSSFIIHCLLIGIIIMNWSYVSHAIPYSVCEVIYLVVRGYHTKICGNYDSALRIGLWSYLGDVSDVSH